MNIYDVAIVGAGPAGSMLARFLQSQKLKVALIDARRLGEEYKGQGRIKSCGGMLAPDAQKFLHKHNIKLPKRLLDDIQPQSVKTYDLETKQVRFYKRNYLNIDREGFDRFLLKGVKVDKYFGWLVNDIRYESGHYILNHSIKAKILVGADGATSKIRRMFFPNLKVREYVSIQDVLDYKKTNIYECYFDNRISNYYGWSLPKDDVTLVGYALPLKNDAVKQFEKFKEDNGFEGKSRRQGTFILRPNFFHSVSCKKNLFLIGEAGGYISPSSAEGMSYAFKTAKILADSKFNPLLFRIKMFPVQINIFYKNIKSLFMYNKFLRKIVMKMSFLK